MWLVPSMRSFSCKFSFSHKYCSLTPVPFLYQKYILFSGWFIRSTTVSNLSPLLSDRIMGTFFKLPVPCKRRLKLWMFLLTLTKLMRTFTDKMQKMLRVALVYIIKHLWNMWKARGLLGVPSTLHNRNCKNLCKFHLFFFFFGVVKNVLWI